MKYFFAVLSISTGLIACGGENPDSTAIDSGSTDIFTNSADESLANDSINGETTATNSADNTASQLQICAARLGRRPADLDREIRNLTGKNNYNISVDAAGTDGINITWDHSSADVICTNTPPDTSSLNLIQKINTGQVLYGSEGSDYIGELNGGIVFGRGGRDIVATLNDGTFYGEEGNDLVDTPLDHGLFNGWSFAPTVSGGIRDGTFVGGDGDDHIGAMSGGEFHGGDGQDSVRILQAGTFYGGNGKDSVSDPMGGESGEMSGGHFYGEGGNDWVDRLYGGSFKGGADDDLVQSISSASFEGMQGEDTVYTLGTDGIFTGGAGADTVDSMSDGVYDGGEDSDTLEVYAEGRVVNVESVPSCLQSVSGRSKCLVLPAQ